MKVSYNWLKEHVALDVSTEELSRHLLKLGFEVASVEKRGPAFKGVVTAKVLEKGKHPNADRLALCKVTDGTTEFSVVCGAPNVAAGQTVALARVGAELPGGKKLTPAKIRGVESQGMLCSGAELGLTGDHAGILVLSDGTALGQDFAAMQGPADDILEVEITPNRPDCLSHRGLARELAACFDVPLKPLSPLPPLSAEGDCPPISVEDTKACPVYVGRVLTGVKIGSSPGWLIAKLEAIGLRPINNVVDVTNYILMDLGQPMHAFDLAKLAGPEIRVRSSNKGESIKTLDGKTYNLTGQLVIADAKVPAAIAGVMGGLDSSVTEKTTAILLESAHFAPPVVRKSSQAFRLKSDSSYRFERGTDPGAVELASERAAALLLKLCGGKATKPRVAGAVPASAPAIIVSSKHLNAILGSDFKDDAVEGALKAISAGTQRLGDTMSFQPPSYRADLQTPWDLAEETARILGYDRVPSEAAPIAPRAATLTESQTLTERLRDRLAGYGLYEAYNYDFVSEKQLERARLDASGLARLANPLSDDWAVLRPTLLIGLLENALTNLNRGAHSVRLFEIGQTFLKAGDEVAERRHAAGVLIGPPASRFWRGARTPDADFHEAKGLVAELLSGVSGLSWKPKASSSFFHPGGSLRVETSAGELGAVGLLHPTLARAMGLDRQPVAVFDLDLDTLLSVAGTKQAFVPFSAFPGSRRDLSLLIDKAKPYLEIETAARQGAGEHLQLVELVDVFAGKGLPEGKHSLTLRLTFGSLQRTLTDAEVNSAVDGALAQLKALGAELRA